MATADTTRRLTAIVAADVAEFSRLVAANEEETLAALRVLRVDVIDTTVTKYRGRIANTAGDSLLIEFPSIVEALRFSVALQRSMRERNEALPSDRRIQYRLGINLGDVIEQDGDILGDGVNVAARLEGIAEPGGICISGAALDQVRGRVDVGFEDLGDKNLKNIPLPVRVYRVAWDGRRSAVAPSRKAVAMRRFVLPALLVAIAGGGLLWWKPWHGDGATEPVRGSVSVPTDRPSIAVLPFTNMSGDKEQEYFADGMTEDLITDLSKVSGLFVIARNSTFTYKGRSVQVQQIAHELGVRYLLEGSVRRLGGSVRINAQLIDATTGGHLWAERYDGAMAEVFALQNRVIGKIVSALSVRLAPGEPKSTTRPQTESSVAYDIFLKGWGDYLRQRPDEFRRAIARFEEAIKLDPNYSRAHAALAATYWQIWRRSWQDRFGFTDQHSPRVRAEGSLQQAMRNPNPLALQLSAAMLSQQGRHGDAIAAAERAIALDANNADSYVALADALSLAGRGADALRQIEHAIRLNPFYPPFYLYELGLARFVTNSLSAAAETLERAISLNPEDNWSARLLIATYGLLDRTEKIAGVRDLAERHLRAFDPLSVRSIAFWYPFKQTEDAERLATGLRRAGVPD